MGDVSAKCLHRERDEARAERDEAFKLLERLAERHDQWFDDYEPRADERFCDDVDPIVADFRSLIAKGK